MMESPQKWKKALIIVLIIIVLIVTILIVKGVWTSVGEAFAGEEYFGLGPGGCNNEAECIDYCTTNPDECMVWCEEHDVLCPPVLKENLEGLRLLKNAEGKGDEPQQ